MLWRAEICNAVVEDVKLAWATSHCTTAQTKLDFLRCKRFAKLLSAIKMRCACASDRSPDVDLSDDDEGPEDVEDWSNDELSDSDQPLHDDDTTRMRTRTRKSGRGPNRPAAARVRALCHSERN